ncbi:MAG: methionyl-tRNA formyltransferase [Elusimicrobia bacterium]|nr:methionyl-tRNA formyltransferase [Elusimicrobiota bacterium]
MNRVRVILCGMTGFGNGALRGLLADPSVEVAGLVCPRPESAPFPHYPCPKVYEEAARAGVRAFPGARLKDPAVQAELAALAPDLIVVASFRQIIPPGVISLPRFGVINIHPSLLPRYRGATPSVWAILNGEEETGVTIHFIDDERLDQGRIVGQRRLRILPDEDDGSLRRRLAELESAMIAEAVAAVAARPKASFPGQDESQSSWFPMRGRQDTILDPAKPVEELRRRIRANSPWPGALLIRDGAEIVVSGVEEGAGPAEERTVTVSESGRTLRFLRAA